jgi:hypothetical protein
MVGTVSRTARVSGVTRNLKEAAGKILARRTEIAYEAVASGREGKYLQSPITIQEGAGVYAAGINDLRSFSVKSVCPRRHTKVKVLNPKAEAITGREKLLLRTRQSRLTRLMERVAAGQVGSPLGDLSGRVPGREKVTLNAELASLMDGIVSGQTGMRHPLR